MSAHLHTTEKIDNAIPYITSYYSDSHWGFCVTRKEFEYLKENSKGCTVFIQSEEYEHFLSIGERHFGNRENYVIVSTYLCHPSLANNELSGPLVLAGLVRLFEESKVDLTSFGVKFLIWPETIGAIAYEDLHKNGSGNQKPQPVITLTCLGLKRDSYEIISGRNPSWNHQIADILKVDRNRLLGWQSRGSDERQLNFPAGRTYSVTISKGIFGSYPEYHTDADNLDLIDFQSIDQVIHDIYGMLIKIVNTRRPYFAGVNEPFLSALGIYPEISKGNSKSIGKDLNELLLYCDGMTTEEEIMEKIPGFSTGYVRELLRIAAQEKLIS